MAKCKKIMIIKNCDIVSKIELEFGLDEKGVFTASGYVYNKGQLVHGGQCINVIEGIAQADKIKDPAACDLIYKVAQWWKLYHLNNMHAGTPEQENALLSVGLKEFANKYEECCEYLKKIGLLVVRGHKFGCKWLMQEIPADIQKDILETIEKNNQ